MYDNIFTGSLGLGLESPLWATIQPTVVKTGSALLITLAPTASTVT